MPSEGSTHLALLAVAAVTRDQELTGQAKEYRAEARSRDPASQSLVGFKSSRIRLEQGTRAGRPEPVLLLQWSSLSEPAGSELSRNRSVSPREHRELPTRTGTAAKDREWLLRSAQP